MKLSQERKVRSLAKKTLGSCETSVHGESRHAARGRDEVENEGDDEVGRGEATHDADGEGDALVARALQQGLGGPVCRRSSSVSVCAPCGRVRRAG